MGMSPDTFCRLFPEEFTAAVEAYNKREELRMQRQWDMVRTLAAITIQPHVKKRVTPMQLLPLPWDKAAETDEKATGEKKEVKILTAEEHRRRKEELERRFKR